MSIATRSEMDTSPARRSGSIAAASPILLFALGIAVWQVYAMVAVPDPGVLPSPVRVAEQGWGNRAVLVEHSLVTLRSVLIGISLSLICAAILATAMEFASGLRRCLLPALTVTRALPFAAAAPLLILWFGAGTLPTVLVVVAVSVGTLTVAMAEGFRSADDDAVAMIAGMGARRWTAFRLIRLPAAAPRLFPALRLGIGCALVGAVFAEYVGARDGLGAYLRIHEQSAQADLVIAALVGCGVVSAVPLVVAALAQRVLAPWVTRIGRPEGRP